MSDVLVCVCMRERESVCMCVCMCVCACILDVYRTVDLYLSLVTHLPWSLLPVLCVFISLLCLMTWLKLVTCHKLQMPWLSCTWRGFQTWDTLQDSAADCSIDKAETSLEQQEHFLQFQDMTVVLPRHIHLPVCLWIMNPHSRAAKKNMSHGNEMLLQDTTHPIQRSCYQRGSLCQNPAGNQTIQRPPDCGKEMQTEVGWTCLL